MMQFCSSAFDGTFADGNVVDRADMDSVGFVHFRVFRIFILYSHQRIMFLLFLYFVCEVSRRCPSLPFLHPGGDSF